MASVPTTRTWVAGEVVTDAFMNNTIRDVENFLLARPLVQASQLVAQSLTTAVFAPITMTGELVDSSGMHSTVSNTSRFTAVYPGYYGMSGAVATVANATGRRMSKWTVNGGDWDGTGIYMQATAASVAKVPAANISFFLNVNDFAELQGAQESGGPLNTAVASSVDRSYAKLIWESN